MRTCSFLVVRYLTRRISTDVINQRYCLNMSSMMPGGLTDAIDANAEVQEVVDKVSIRTIQLV